jgi:hypothetical protein
MGPVVGLAATMLAGCGGTVGGGTVGGTVGGTAFERALTRIDGPSGGRVEFVDARALAQAAAGGGPWAELVGGTGNALDTYRGPLSDVLAVDLAKADTVLTAGNAPERVTLVAGGQDEDRIRSAATAAGWSGGDELRTSFSVEQPLSLVAGALRPMGADVAAGGPDAELGVVDGPGESLSEDASVAMPAECLGEVVVAVVSGGATPADPVHAVGLRRDPAAPDGAPLQVLCVAADAATAAAVTEAVRTGRSALTGQPYADYLADAQVEHLDGAAAAVRVVARTGPQAGPAFLLQALDSGDLPGLGR